MGRGDHRPTNAGINLVGRGYKLCWTRAQTLLDEGTVTRPTLRPHPFYI